MMFLRRHGRRYDLPLDRDGAQRLLPWIVALMTYIAAMTLLAAMVLGSLAWRWTDEVSGAVTVLLPPTTDPAVGSTEGRILGVRDALVTLERPQNHIAAMARPIAPRPQPLPSAPCIAARAACLSAAIAGRSTIARVTLVSRR